MTLTEGQREALEQIAEEEELELEFWPEEAPTMGSFDPVVENFSELADKELLATIRERTGLKVTVEEGVIYAKV